MAHSLEPTVARIGAVTLLSSRTTVVRLLCSRTTVVKHWSKQKGLAAGIVRDVIQAICSATCFVIGVLLEHVNAKISCTALKYCVSHAEMVQRYSQEP